MHKNRESIDNQQKATIIDPFILVKLRKSEIEEIKKEYVYHKNNSNKDSDEAKYCTKIIKRLNKALSINQ